MSTFECTLADYPPISELLSEEITEWFGFMVLMYKFVLGFAVIGVINGVFIEETFRAVDSDDVIMVRNKKRIAASHRNKMKELFAVLDSSRDGVIDIHEFRTAIKRHKDLRLWLESMDLFVEKKDVDSLFHLLDADGSGDVTFEELIEGVDKLKGSARSIDLMRLSRELQIFSQKMQNTTHTIGTASKRLHHDWNTHKLASNMKAEQVAVHRKASSLLS